MVANPPFSILLERFVGFGRWLSSVCLYSDPLSFFFFYFLYYAGHVSFLMA